MNAKSLTAGLPPVHPGELIAGMIAAEDFPHSKTAVAEALGINRNGLYLLLNGKTGITANMALRLSRVLGSEPDFWMRLQATYDLKMAREALGDQLEALPVLASVRAAAAP